MDGNEQDSCSNCKQTIGDEQHHKCDLCIRKMHKTCASLSASEVKCMPLQKRLLVLLCNDCRQMMSNTPQMVQIMEEMKNELTLLKTEIRELKTEMSVRTNSENLVNFERSFADVTKKTEINKAQFTQTPTLIIKPKQKQSSEKTKSDLKQNIKPDQLNVGIQNLRETKQGCIVIKCAEKKDIDRIRQAAENSLNANYTIETPKLNLPRMKIVGYTGDQNSEELEQVIRQQNTWIGEEDKINITFIKKAKNKNVSTIFFECSSKLYWKMIAQKKIFIGWERYNVYENLTVTRCFQCQEHYHKIGQCENGITCAYCAGNHESSACTKQIRKCKNCSNANTRYVMNYDTSHAASDTECPSTRYHINLLRSRIDYGT